MREGQNDPAYVKAGADAAYAYAIAVSDANHNYVTSMADARQFIVTSNSCDNRTADRRYPWSWAVVVVSHSSAATIYNTFVKALNQAQYDYGVANVENGNFSSSALSDLWDDYQNAKRDRDTDSANTAATDNRNFQDDHSQADHDYAIAAMRAQSKRTREYSKLDLAYTIDVTPDSTEYENDKVTLVATRNNWDATSSKDFKFLTATYYASQMNSFHGTHSSAWSLYHQQLGVVEVAWATASGTLEKNYVTGVGNADIQFSISTTALDATRVIGNTTAEDVYVLASVTARNAYADAAGAAKLARAKAQAANSEESAHNQNNNANENSSDSSTRESAQAEELRDAEKDFQLAMLAAQLALANASADASRDYAIATGNAWESYFSESIDYQGYVDALEDANDAYNDAMEAAYDAFNAAAKAAWDALKAAYADALRNDQKGDANDNHGGAHDDANEKDRFAGDELAAAIAEAAALRAAAIILATSTANANKVKAATIAENERAFSYAAAIANKTRANTLESLQASRRELDFIANAAQREDAISVRGMYEVNVYTNMETTISSQTVQLGITLASYRQAVAAAERIRANLIRIAKDAFEDAVSLAGLTELQAINVASISRTTALSNAEVVYAQNVAAAEKGQTIAYANSYYDLYLANATAEAILREVISVSLATIAREKVGIESDKSKSIADAELARANALADALHALQTALNADWVPIEWNGWGYGGWGYGWGGWYGGWGGWYGGWGGWYGWGGYVFGYAAYGWGGYGYGGFGGWNGFGWGFGTWSGGWGWGWGGYGWGYGGSYGGDHGDDQDNYDDEVDEIEDDYNDALDDANETAKDELAAAKMAEAVRNGGAGIAFATARGSAGLAYVIAKNTADDQRQLATTVAQQLHHSVVVAAEHTFFKAIADAKRVKSNSTMYYEIGYRSNIVPAEAAFVGSAATAQANYAVGVAQSALSNSIVYANAGPLNQYRSAYAQAKANWTQTVATAFVQREIALASSQRALSTSIANLESTQTASQNSNEIDYRYTEADLEKNYELALKSLKLTNDQANGVAIATRRLERANSTKSLEIGVATDAKTFGIAKVQAEIDFEISTDDYRDAVKAATVAFVASTQNKNVVYGTAEHNSRKSFANTTANETNTWANNVTGLEREFKQNLATAANVRTVADIEAAFVIASNEIAPQNTANYATSQANLAFWTASASAAVGANAIISSSLNTPWAQYLVSSANVASTWLSSVSATYLSLTTDRNLQQSNYVSSTIAQKKSRDLAAATLTKNYGFSVATASHDAAIFQSNKLKQYLNNIATASWDMEQEIVEKTAQKAIAHANGQYNGNWDSQIQQAITNYTSIEVAQQTSYRQSRSQSQYNLEMGLIAHDVSLADAKDGLGQSFHAAASLSQATRAQSRAALDSVYALFEKTSIASALSAAQNGSPWMANDAAKAIALANWYGVMAPAKATMDGSRAIAQKDLENAFFGAQSQWIDRELPEFRDGDKQRAFQRASEIATLHQNPIPDPSLAPNLGFYSNIVQGVIPEFVARGFIPTQAGHFATSGSGIGDGGYGIGNGYGYGGTSILNPNGTPSGFGLGSPGNGFGTGASFGNGDSGSPTSRVNWDLVGEADAIQSEDNASALIDLYWVDDDGMRSILDSENSTSGQSNGNGGYGGYGGGEGGGSGEGGGGSTAADLSAKKRVLDFNAFKLFLKRIDPAALKVFEDGGGRIERRGAWIPWTETSVSHRGTPRNGDLTFWIDENWNEFDAAMRVAEYIAESRTEVRARYDYNTMSDPRTSVEAAQSFRKKWYKDAAELTEMGVGAYLGFLSIANEGIDLIVTVDELSKGNWAASIGLLPFVPAGGAVRIVDKLGNAKLISNEMMHKLSKLGDVTKIRQMLDGISDDIWCFAPDTLVSTPSGKRRIDSLFAGERVCSFDERQSAWIAAEIMTVHKNLYSGLWCRIRTAGGMIEATAHHPIWVEDGVELESRPKPVHFLTNEDIRSNLNGRWVNSHELRVGDRLQSHDGLAVYVEAIEFETVEDKVVCNLTVEGVHTFAIGDDAILAHNKSWCDALADKDFGGKPGSLVALVGKGLTDRGKLITSSLIHGHHIVMKSIPKMPWDKRIPYIKNSQAILEKYDVKLLGKIEDVEKASKDEIHNLCYAINGYKGIHSLEYVKEVDRRLNMAVKDATRQGVVNKELATQKIIEALAEMKKSLEKGDAFWPPHNKVLKR
jgi:hypothetical protein